MDEVTANQVYDILVEHAGLADHDYEREAFVHSQTHDHPVLGHTTEYRFIGSLGFGGKFWRTPGRAYDGAWSTEVWRVDFYPEDSTPERLNVKEATNAALSKLREIKENDE